MAKIIYPHSDISLDNEDYVEVLNSLKKHQLTSGDAVTNLKRRFMEFTEKDYAICVSSAANAIFLSLRAMDIKPQDEVILPSYICNSVWMAVNNSGAIPILADVDENDINITYSSVKSKLTSNTKAMLIPHMFGKYTEDLDKIISLGIPVIEDCAMSLGSEKDGIKSGTLGEIGIYSFYPTKMIAGAGGGMIVTDNKKLQDKIDDLMKYDNRPTLGEFYSMNMNNLSAALALSQFNKLNKFIARRNEIANIYDSYFSQAGIKYISFSNGSIHYRYILNISDTKTFIAAARKRGVDCRHPIYRPLHQYSLKNNIHFPNSDYAMKRFVSIPIYPRLTDIDAKKISEILIRS